MADISRYTGEPIDNLSSALQGAEIILSTRLRSRVLNRGFGAGVIECLGRRLTPRLFTALQQLIGTAIDRWEPRLAVRRVSVSGTVDGLRSGNSQIKIEADFRPGALQDPPDYQVDQTVEFYLFNQAGQLKLAS